MAKVNIDTNDDVLLANVNRYTELAFKLNKSSAEQTELSGLQSILADYLLIASDYNNVVTQQNTNTGDIGDNTDLIGNNETNLNIARTAKDTTGTANVYLVDTDGTFDLTKDGNILPLNPNITNTGASTVNPDSQGVKNIKKWDSDTTAYINIEADDIKKNVHVFLRWDLSEGFFVLAPKGGGSPIIRTVSDTFNITIGSDDESHDLSVTFDDIDNCIITGGRCINPEDHRPYNSLCSIEIVDTDTIKLQRVSTSRTEAYIVNITEYDGSYVKSSQSGSTVGGDASKVITVSSYDPQKSIISMTIQSSVTDDDPKYDIYSGIEMTSSTSITIFNVSSSSTVRWQLLELK